MNSAGPNDETLVAIAEDATAGYPAAAPFRPGESYPELAGRVPCDGEPNAVYRLLRELFRELGFDAENNGKPAWNPLGGVIRPGDKVVVKPNLVRHKHMAGGPYEAVVASAAVVRAVLDYVALALRGRGEIVVGDAPVQSADFAQILERTGLQRACDDVAGAWGIPVRVVDFRLWAVNADERHHLSRGRRMEGDAGGYRAVDLGSDSLLAPLGEGYRRFRVTSYDCGEMERHHNLEVNEYLVPQAILDADVVLNIPKLKTHRKVGLTAALKNLVGINGHKDWLPHHSCGSVEEGGDEYQRKSRLKEMKAALECKLAVSPGWSDPLRDLGVRITTRLSSLDRDNPYEEGSWYGNNTLWRTVLDLNRLLRYAFADGRMADTPQRGCFTIVDGILAGEGEGPMEPDARSCGILAGGANPVAIDAVLATLVGFDYRKIPIIANAFAIERWPLTPFAPEEVRVATSSERWRDLKVGSACHPLDFAPPAGWRGHIELGSR